MSWLSDFVEGAFETVIPAAITAAIATVVTANPIIGLQTFAVMTVSGGVGNALYDEPSAATFSQEASGRDVMVRQSAAPRKVIYGSARVSGPILFMDTTDEGKYLHLVVAVAPHEVENLASKLFNTATVFFNDEQVDLSVPVSSPQDRRGVSRFTPNDQFAFLGQPLNPFANLARFKFYDGTQTHADADLVDEVSDWTESHILNGISYFYARLEYDADAYPTSIPNISMDVDGKKVAIYDGSSVAFSDNPARVIRDYLVSKDGLNVPQSEINEASFQAAQDACDETVNLADGTTQKRYTLNGVVDLNKSKELVLKEMLTSMAGQLIRTNGQWYLYAGEYRAPTVTLDEDDLTGPISVQTKTSRRDNFNTVRGQFIGPDTNFQLSDYPEFTSQTFQDQDGEKIAIDMDLPFTDTPQMCQRLAKIALLRQRQQIVLNLPCKLSAFKLRPGDTVNITNAKLGFSAKPFSVEEWALINADDENGNPILGVNLVLREISSTIYDFTTDEESPFDPAPNTTLPSAYTVGGVGLTVTDEIRLVNGTATTVLVSTVTGGGPFAAEFQVEARKSTDTEFTIVGRGAGNIFDFFNVEDGVSYDVRARAINQLGRKGEFSNVTHQIVGKTAPPADVTGLRINVVGAEAHLSWDAVADLDLSHYIVRFSTDTTSPSFSNAVTVIPKVTATSVVVPARTGTYFVRAVDTSGNRSVTPTSIGTDIQTVAGLNVVATSTQHPTFAGIKTDCVIDEDSFEVPVLKLRTAILFDAKTGNFEDADGQFDGGGGEVDGDGVYEFDGYIDLGSRYTSRVTASLDVVRVDYIDLFDSATGLFDSRDGNFDGGQNVDDTNVTLFVSLTNDDPAGSPTWSDYKEFTVGDYSARALRFKANLSSVDDQATPAIKELSVEVDMPDRITADNDIASGTAAGGKVVTFSPEFKALQGLAIVAENMETGDFYDIVSKDATGFTIRFKNSGGTVVDRTFDYVAKGYGELVA